MNSAHWGNKLLYPNLLPRITFAILPRIPSTAQRSMCELFFGKSKWDENGPFITSHKDIPVSIQHRPLANVARSCRITRHSPFLAPVMLPFTLLFDHPRRADPSMNGLTQRNMHTDLFVTHYCAPHPHRGATESSSLWQSTIAGVTSFAMARLLRACHNPQWQRLISWHGRVALCDTTVPDSTWHGVSGGGASEACLAKTLAQGRSVPSQQILV